MIFHTIDSYHTIGTVNSYFQHYWFGWVIYEFNRLWGAKIRFTVTGKKINKWLLVDRLSQFYRFTTNTFYSIPTHSIVTAATKLGQGNIFTSVCQEFCPQGGGEGVCLSACWDTLPPPRQSRQPPPPPGGRLQHTVNEQPVRILLECILLVEVSDGQKQVAFAAISL